MSRLWTSTHQCTNVDGWWLDAQDFFHWFLSISHHPHLDTFSFSFLFPGPALPFSFHFFFLQNFFSFNSHHTDLPIAHISPTYQLTTPPPPLVLVYAYLPTSRVLLSPPPPPPSLVYLPTYPKEKNLVFPFAYYFKFSSLWLTYLPQTTYLHLPTYPPITWCWCQQMKMFQ